MRTIIFFTLFFLVLCAACVAAESIVFDFETGNLAQEDWTIIEGANSKPIGSRDREFHNENIPYDKHGEYYLTTLESAANAAPTDDTICVIESPVFILTGKEATLLVGGGRRPNTYVALCPVFDDGNIGNPIRKAQGKETQKLDEIVWHTNDLLGKPFVLQVVDKETGGWAHIRMDYFRTEGNIDANLTALRKKYLEETVEREKLLVQEQRKAVIAKLEHPILYVQRHQYHFDHHNTETLFQTGEISTNLFRPGSALRLWNPADDSVRTLLEVPNGVVRDPALHFDATKVLLSIRKDITDDYNIYELQLDAGAFSEKGRFSLAYPFDFCHNVVFTCERNRHVLYVPPRRKSSKHSPTTRR